MNVPARKLIFRFLSSHPTILVRHFCGSYISHPSSSSSPSRTHRNEEEIREVKVTVWWDFENCAIPVGVNPYSVVHQISSALRLNGIKGPLKITAYGNILQLSHATQDALCKTGISLNHVPNCGKNSTDMSMLADLVYWVDQNPPPAHFLLISGDKDFVSILHRLRQRNYNILVASCSLGSPALNTAATIMWNWSLMVKGDNLMGRHFNYPPDGRYGSWYGHFKGALVDPLVDAAEASNTLSDPDGSSKQGVDHKFLRIIARKMKPILSSHADGISLSDLHRELSKSGVVYGKDYHGYKKFSSLVSSLTDIAVLKPDPSCNSNFIVYSASSKPALDYPGPRSVPNVEVDSLKDVAGNGENSKLLFQASHNDKEKSSNMHDKDASPPTSLNHFTEEDEELSDLTFHTSNGEGTDVSDKIRSKDSDVNMSKDSSSTIFCNSDGMQREAQESHCISSTNTSFDDAYTKPGDLKPVDRYGNSFIKGFFQKCWRTWLGSIIWPTIKTSSDISLKNSLKNEHIEKSPPFVDSSSEENTQIGSKVEVVDCQMGSPLTSKISTDQSEDKQALCEKDLTDPTINTQSHFLFSKKHFWSSLEAFLRTSKGCEVVSKSLTRDHLMRKFQSEGPKILSSLTDSDISCLIELLVTKKWVNENSFRMFPFEVTLPVGRSSIPSHNCGSERLSHLFSCQGSQSPSVLSKGLEEGDQISQNCDIGQIPPKNLAKLKHWYSKNFDGNTNVKVEDFSAHFEKQFGRKIDAKCYGYFNVQNLLAACTTVRQVTRNEMLSDCQSLVEDCFLESPAGVLLSSLEPMFSEKYGYCLDLKKLGYKKISDMINSFPGARVSHGLIVPNTDRASNHAIFEMVKKNKSGTQTVDMEDCSWEELGSFSETQMLESRQKEGQIQLDEVTLSDEESIHSDNITSPGVDGKKVPENQNNQKSTLVELLESWHDSKLDDKNKSHAADELVNILEHTSTGFRSKTSKKYNFVNDSGDDKFTMWLKKSRSQVNT